MNGSAKRMMAMIAALVMVASAMVIVFVDEQDSSADPVVDYGKYYYDQLETDFSKSVYNKVIAVDNFDGGLDITIDTITAADKASMGTDTGFISEEINKGVMSAGYDNPLMNYYLDSTHPVNDDITYDSVGYSWVSFTLNKNLNFDATKVSYETAMSTEIARIFTEDISKAQAVPNLITAIHNYVANTLTYNLSGDPSLIRSVYTSLCGNHQVVCEGYAKMFKVLCDDCDIPCIIVTGKAGTGSMENHMWNYVKVGDYWFLMDCTWDDQQENEPPSIEENYLMAGTHTMGFNSTLVKDSHDPTGLNGLTIELPVLSYYSYADLSVNTQHLVTFKLYEDRVYTTEYCGDGYAVDQPADPVGDVGDHFFGWFIGETEYNFSNAVTEDLTITAQWVTVKVFKLVYDTSGGTNVQATRVETSDSEDPNAPSKVIKVTSNVPFREGFEFKGWNTAKDGNGLWYDAGDDVVLTSDEFTLYAIWEDTSTMNYKIDSYVDKASAFLSDETIPGLSNMLLTIAVITTAVSLLAILAISRK